MSAVLTLQATIFALVFLGFILKRHGIVSSDGQKGLTDLVIYVILPCNILDAFTKGTGRDRIGDYLGILLVALGIQLLSLLYGKLAYHSQPEGKRKCLEYGTLCNNAGFIGNPIVEGVYGASGLALASVYLIPLRIMMWSSGLAVFSGNRDRKAAFRRVATHPCILACLLGIVLMLSGLSLPTVIAEPVQTLGRCNTAMSMLVIGMILARIDFRHFWDKSVLIYCAHRLLLMPALFWLLCRFLPLEHEVFGVSVLLTAMPAGATTSILAEKYNMEPEFATKLVIVSTLLSLPTVCLWTVLMA